MCSFLVAESCLIVSTGSFALLLCVRDPLLRRLILDVLSLLFRCSRNSSDNKSVKMPSYWFPPFLEMDWIFNSFLFLRKLLNQSKAGTLGWSPMMTIRLLKRVPNHLLLSSTRQNLRSLPGILGRLILLLFKSSWNMKVGFVFYGWFSFL